MNTVKKLAGKIGLPKTNWIVVLGFLLLFIIAAASPNYTMAQERGIVGKIFGWAGFALGGILGSVVAWIIYVLNYIMVTILGVAVALIIWFIQVFLQLNTQIPTSLVVKEGFRITLGVVNLGFVLGIIVIAIATILRYEQYGLKKILIKLVAAAILVNFSLVIAGVILNFSDQLTGYFVGAVNPGGSVGNFFKFGDSLAGAFAPQRVFLNVSITGDNPSFSIADAARKFEGSAGQDFGAIFTPLLNILFPSIMLIMVVITLFALLVMLLIRYVFLSILLILMPFAWLLWVFPNFQSTWNKWWHNFLRWTFFAPIMMFFLYLAILTGSAMSARQANNPIAAFQGMEYNSNSPLVGGISSFFGGFVNQVIGTILQMGVMVGLVIGGLFAANSFGITFANTAMEWAKSMGKGVGGWAGRKSKQAGGAVLSRLDKRLGGERKLSERLQKAQIGAGGNRFTRAMTAPVRYGAGWLGRGMEDLSVTTRENLVKDAKKRLGDRTKDQLTNNMSTLTGPERVAATQLLFEHGDIENARKYGSKTDFERFGQGEYYSKFNKQGRFADDEMLSVLPDAMSGNFDRLDQAIRDFTDKISKSDVSQNKQLNDIFSGGEFMERSGAQNNVLNERLIRHMALARPELISTIIPKLHGKALQNFQDLFTRARRTMTPDEARDTSDRFRQQITNNVFYGGTGEPYRGTTTPPPAGP